MGTFLKKHYPSIEKLLHERRILALMESLEKEKGNYKKEYNVEFNS